MATIEHQFCTNTRHEKIKDFEKDVSDKKSQRMCMETFGTCHAADFW